MASRATGSTPIIAPSTARSIYVVGGIAALMVGSLGLGIYTELTGSDNETFRFIVLLIIFMTALATTAAVFVGLRISNGTEAFGLPSGSIRALLAIGIMILFVVFGLPLVSPPPGEAVPPRIVEVPHEQRSDTIQENRQLGFHVRVLDAGSPAVAPRPPATTPASSRPARLEIFGRVSHQSAAQLDINKQMLTAIVTLLTTVVGFYFGSRSATDGIKEGGTAIRGTAAADLPVLRKQIEEAFEALKLDIASAGARIDALRQDPATAASPPRQTALSQVAPYRAKAEQHRDEIARLLAAADASLAALAAAADTPTRTRHESAARDSLQRAADLLRAARDEQQVYSEKVKAIG